MDCHIPSVYPLSTYQYILSISIHPLNINTPSQHILIHPLKTYPNTLSIFLLNIQPLKTTSNRQPRPLTTPLWFTHPPAHSPTHPLTHPLTRSLTRSPIQRNASRGTTSRPPSRTYWRRSDSDTRSFPPTHTCSHTPSLVLLYTYHHSYILEHIIS